MGFELRLRVTEAKCVALALPPVAPFILVEANILLSAPLSSELSPWDRGWDTAGLQSPPPCQPHSAALL